MKFQQGLSWSRLDCSLQAATCVAFVGWAFAYALRAAIHLPTNHLDGAFQTASGLFRLQAGQFPGRDFLPYLGVGPLVLLFPIFKVMGANLAASVFATQFVTLLLGWLAVFLLWRLIFNSDSLMPSLAGAAALFVLVFCSAQLFSYPLQQGFTFYRSPGNSLRPIRAIAPYLVMLVYYLGIHPLKGYRWKFGLAGSLAGVTLLWSNDFAIPTAGSLMLLVATVPPMRTQCDARNGCTFLGAMLGSWGLLVTLLTFGHPNALLRYNFVDVAKDQWWYFALYDAHSRVFSLLDVGRLFSNDNYFPLAVLGVLALMAIRTRWIELTCTAWIGAVLFAGGVLASVGGHLGGYFAGFHFWAVVVCAVALCRIMHLLAVKMTVRNPRAFAFSRVILLVAITGAMTARAASHCFRYKTTRAEAIADPSLFYVPELGGYLRIEWQDYIDLARKTTADSVVEEYWGIWSATRGSLPVWPVDSVIHALGSARQVAIEGLRRADLIISTRHSAATEWQPWSLSQNFWFYDDLLTWWTPYASSPTTVVWRRREQARLGKPTECSIADDRQTVSLDEAEPGFYSVEIGYSFRAKGRSLLMIRNGISFAADANGYVSLDPSGRLARLPVYVSEPGTNRLEMKVVGPTAYELQIATCEAQRILLVDDDVLYQPGSPSQRFYISDSNWERGIARRWAGFFVPNKPDYQRRYVAGNVVEFADGTRRRIVRTDFGGPYLNVYVNGEKLDQKKVGVPAEFKVLKGE